ncbi:MAG: hypothetical protein LUI10_10440 [Lachnospiraceae bacterium]|nr:hypothetical protein [Lachnospiraceae bacterium]
MGISYYNSSGYPDPTAHYAVQHVEQEEKTLHIVYPTGHMDIRVDRFFPCTVDRAKKVFKLICQYCSQEDKDKLLRFLTDKEKRYKSQAQALWSRIESCTDTAERKHLTAQYKEAVRLKDRLNRNIQIFEYREGKTR